MDYNKFISKKAQQLKPSGIRKFFDIAAKMQDVISLGVGEPDFCTPWNIRNAGISSIQKGITQYSANLGMLELRKEISYYLDSKYNIKYDAEKEVLVTVGASEGIDLCMRALLDEGDEILVPEPSYVAYSPCITISGGVAVGVKCTFENKFKVQAKDVLNAITDKTKAIILPYPNNPTGGILEREELKEIAKVIIEKDLLCISDEIYSELTYGLHHTSIAEIDGMRERTVVLNGFSKSFAMTGWRVGYICGARELIVPMYKIHQYGIMCVPTPSQYAAIEALKQGRIDGYESVEDMKVQYNIRRTFLYEFFKEIGMDVFEPQGAFYIFPSTKCLNMTGEEFAERLLEREKVAVVPGSAFGESGKYNIRVSYCYSMTALKNATTKIARFVKEVKGE